MFAQSLTYVTKLNGACRVLFRMTKKMKVSAPVMYIFFISQYITESCWKRQNKNTSMIRLPWHYLLIGASDVSKTERMWEFHRQTGRDKNVLPAHRNINSFIKTAENKTCFISQTCCISQPVLVTFSQHFLISMQRLLKPQTTADFMTFGFKWKGSVILYTCMKYYVYMQIYSYSSTAEQQNEATADVWI